MSYKKSPTIAAPRRRDRKATEAALVAAAAAVFSERGFETATTKAIAERAGYSEALIQNYFQGKEGLLLAVIQAEGGGQAELEEFFDRPLCDTLEADARETLTYMSAVLGRRATGLRIVLSRVLVDPRFRDEFNRVSVRGFIRARLERRFADYAAAGLLAPENDAGLAAEMMVSLNFQLGFMCREILQTTPAETERHIAGYAEAFGRAFSPARPG